MSALRFLLDRPGDWRGTYHLYLHPGEQFTSDSRASIVPVLGGRFVRIDYDWACEGDAQQGSMLLGAGGDGAATVVWIDGWHMGDQFMISRGEAAEGGVKVLGSYAAPPGPDWGWRTELAPEGSDGWRLRMFNVTPEGEEALAVDVVYRS